MHENKVARAIADEVIERHLRQDDRVLAASTTFSETALELSQLLGPDGCTALLSRAMGRAARQHGSLRGIRMVANSPPVLAGVDECVAIDGVAAVTSALDAVIVELFDLLIRLVGEEMTTKLAQQIMTRESPDARREGGSSGT